MKYAVEVASDGMVYIPRFIMIVSHVQMLLAWDTHRRTDTQQGDPISLLL
jgi:hypothetical protein